MIIRAQLKKVRDSTNIIINYFWLGARGRTLKAGTVVLTGSLSEILPASKGDRFKAEFTPLGDVEVRFG